jgi:hypothetical protein
VTVTWRIGTLLDGRFTRFGKDDGAIEDVTFTGITIRDIRNLPFYLRLGARLRRPSRVPVGALRRGMLSDIICDANTGMPSVLSGISGHRIEDIRIDNVVIQAGRRTTEMADAQVSERARNVRIRFGRAGMSASAATAAS